MRWHRPTGIGMKSLRRTRPFAKSREAAPPKPNQIAGLAVTDKDLVCPCANEHAVLRRARPRFLFHSLLPNRFPNSLVRWLIQDFQYFSSFAMLDFNNEVRNVQNRIGHRKFRYCICYAAKPSALLKWIVAHFTKRVRSSRLRLIDRTSGIDRRESRLCNVFLK